MTPPENPEERDGPGCRLRGDDPPVAVVSNFTPVPRPNYRVGVPRGGWWQEILNSDSSWYGGGNWGNGGGVDAVPVPLHARSHSLTVTVPALAAVFFKSQG